MARLGDVTIRIWQAVVLLSRNLASISLFYRHAKNYDSLAIFTCSKGESTPS